MTDFGVTDERMQLLHEMQRNMSFEAGDLDAALQAVEKNSDILKRLKKVDAASGQIHLPDERKQELERLLKKNIQMQKQILEAITSNKELASSAIQEISKRKLVEQNYVSARTEPHFVDKDFL